VSGGRAYSLSMSQPPYGSGPSSPGRHPTPYGDPYPKVDERVGNAQRTTVLELLGRALEEGYLDLDEYEARLTRVTEGKTVAALHAQVADLPPQFHWDPFQPPSKARQEQKQDQDKDSASAMALASIVLGAASIPRSVCFGAGGLAGIAAVFFARKGLRHDSGRTKAIVGLALGILGIVLSIGIVLILLFSPEQTTTRTS